MTKCAPQIGYAPVQFRESTTRAGRDGRIASRGERCGGRHVSTALPGHTDHHSAGAGPASSRPRPRLRLAGSATRQGEPSELCSSA